MVSGAVIDHRVEGREREEEGGSMPFFPPLLPSFLCQPQEHFLQRTVEETVKILGAHSIGAHG